MNSPTFSKIANESKDLKISFLNHTSLINKYSYVIYSRNKLIEKPSNHRQNYVYKYLYIIHSKKNSPWMTSSTKISNIRWKKFLPLHRQILIVNIRTSLDSTHWSNQEASNIRKVVPLYFQITHTIVSPYPGPSTSILQHLSTSSSLGSPENSIFRE